MTTLENPILFEDMFEVTAVNPDGKKYIRVGRVIARTTNPKRVVSIGVDINFEIWPVVAGEKLSIAIASTLDLAGRKDSDVYDHSVFHKQTLMDQYDYVMFGRVYDCTTDDKSADKVNAVASFGGLLMKIEGPALSLQNIRFNEQIYLLIKKVAK